MSDNIHKGDISTYRNAPESFLRERRDELRANIYNPTLTPNELVYSVIIPTTITSGALFYSAWRAVEGAINWLMIKSSYKQWFAKNLKLPSGIGFLTDIKGYADALERTAQKIAGLHANAPTVSVTETVKAILHDTEMLQHSTGRDKLQAFYDNTSRMEMESPAGKARFFEILKEVNQMDPQAHIGQYHLISNAILERMGEVPKTAEEAAAYWKNAATAFTMIGRDTFHILKRDIIDKGIHDNEKIINLVRNPLVWTLTLATAALTASRAYTATRRQKMLSMQSEVSFLETHLQERSEKRQAEISPATSLAGGTVSRENLAEIGQGLAL